MPFLFIWICLQIVISSFSINNRTANISRRNSFDSMLLCDSVWLEAGNARPSEVNWFFSLILIRKLCISRIQTE